MIQTIKKNDYIMYNVDTNNNFFLSLLEKIGLYKSLDKSVYVRIYKNGDIETSYKLINNDIFYVVDNFCNHLSLKPIITSGEIEDKIYHRYLTVEDKSNFIILSKKQLRLKKLNKLINYDTSN